MLVRIPAVLGANEIARMRSALDAADAPWIDGLATAGHQGARVKRNAQLDEASALAMQLGQQLLAAIERNPLFIGAALPNAVYPPMFNRYAGGQHFGDHIDNAVRLLPGGGRLRTDLSCTLFLSAPDEYDGGELRVEDSYGTHSVKLPAGDMVVYPSTSLHRVEPVTRGARVASFFWVQSLVKDDGRRSLLFDMDCALQRLAASGADERARVQLTGCYHNLLRMWSEL
ncbi:Fe2+-dependent dioxygenase [Derxia lacustris]|uniref:Fe2+-dependent dioxygenase n=1 Tax=Derxia lacustris TaxID=764842 RepID=UPI000A177648|nr:Fe2+-dependent dioxygenase [Derxia lacustris]